MDVRGVLALALVAACRWNFALIDDEPTSPATTDDAGFIVDDGGTRVPCTVDDDCGRCQRCENQFCQRATFVELGIAQRNACALDERGEVWCWGNNGYYSVSDELPYDTRVARPRRRTETAAPFDALAVGWGVVYLRSVSGALVGLGSLDGDAFDTSRSWTSVSATNFNGCGTTSDGEIHCSGDNSFGQLGRPTPGEENQPLGQFSVLSNWLRISPGDVTCAIDTASRLLCVGNNDSGELGRGFSSAEEPDIVQVGTDMDWAHVDVGQEHVCALKQNGTLWCWGDVVVNAIDRTVPVQIGTDVDWTGLDTYYETSCAVRGATELWCMGDNSAVVEALIGTRTTPWAHMSVLVDSGTAPEVGATVGCVRQSGQWVCWGDNVDGVVGVGKGPGLIAPTALCE